MKTSFFSLCSCAVASFWGVCVVSAQIIAPEFSGDYAVFQLGSVQGVPTNYGGLTIRPEEPDFLYIGGAANLATGAVYRAPIFRDGDGFITGFGAGSSLRRPRILTAVLSSAQPARCCSPDIPQTTLVKWRWARRR